MATAEQIRAFLDRPWARLRAEKDRHLAERISREGAETGLHMAASLRAHAAALGATPSAEERTHDLAAAVRLRKLLDRAARHRRRAR